MVAILFLFFTVALPTNNAFAESPLRAYGEAQNNYYKERKKLGPNATAEQKSALAKKTFERANQLMKADREKKLKDYSRASNGFMRKTAKESKLAKSGKGGEKPSETSGTPASGGASSSSASPGQTGKHRVGTTGTVTGSAGAKEMRLEPVQKKDSGTAPTVDGDGIIQDR